MVSALLGACVGVKRPIFNRSYLAEVLLLKNICIESIWLVLGLLLSLLYACLNCLLPVAAPGVAGPIDEELNGWVGEVEQHRINEVKS